MIVYSNDCDLFAYQIKRRYKIHLAFIRVAITNYIAAQLCGIVTYNQTDDNNSYFNQNFLCK